jgi:hypothetical protein
MTNCGQKNSQDSIDINLNDISVQDIPGVNMSFINNESVYTNSTQNYKTYGESMTVLSGETMLREPCLNLDGEQAELLKRVVESLRQVSQTLYMSNKGFMSVTTLDLANEICHKFNINHE